MKLYKLSQTFNRGWFTYDSAIVAAESKQTARHTIPGPFYFYDDGFFYYKFKHQEPILEKTDPSWCHPKHVKVTELGDTKLEAGVVCASMRGGADESRVIDIQRGRNALKANLPPAQQRMILEAYNDYLQQVANNELGFLRYHYLEANRERDPVKVKMWERKIKDYMNEEYEDWS